jgi:serine/threonine protein kinase/tetratricopeptide (TPR) repeat protein
MTDDERLRMLAAAVADGVPIDWRQAESTAADDERELVRQFKVLATVANIHRNDEGTRTAGADDAAWAGDPEAIDRWGSLELRELVGRGGYGTVYRAWDPQLTRDVALKLLNVEHADAQAFERSVITEGRLLARVRHPNVIAVYGADSHDGRVGFWMEFLEGQTLKQWVDAHGRMSSREAAIVGIDICRALAAVHGAGLVHRDVKAQNVMREAGGRTVLMDFGTGAESGRAARLAGTPLYIAPELFADAPATPRTDVYSVGVLLFYLVSGSFPVSGVTLSDIRQAHASGRRQTLRDVRPDLPAAFVRVVDRALSPDPAGRPATAGGLEADLTTSLELLSATPAPVQAPLPRRGARYALMGSIALAAALTVAWASGLWTTVTHRTTAAQVRSLAVLPLRNMTGDPDYFTAGMTDLLTTNLSKVKALRVIASSSVRKYQDDNLPLSDIASALNVDAIVQGTVFRDGDRLRVTAQLVSATDQSSLWAETYERSVRDAFTLQSDLARDIARGIDLSLTPQEQQRLDATRRGGNPAAQEEYLKGWMTIEPRTKEGVDAAVAHFQNAIRLDPEYSRAYSSLALGYYRQSAYGAAPEEAYRQARIAALKAIELDSTQAFAFYALGEVQFNHDWDWQAAAASFRHAIELDPNSADGHSGYGEFLTAQGRFAEALTEMQRARALDPMAHERRSDVAMPLFYMGRYQESEAQLKEILAISKSIAGARFMLGRLYAAMGRTDEALALFADPETKITDRGRCEWARTLVQAGRREEGLQLLRRIEAAPEAQNFPEAVAVVYTALGDRETALDLLARAVSLRRPGALWIKVDPRFAPLRADPRFAALLRQVGLPEE